VISRPQTFSVTSGPLPASRKIHLNGTAHTDVRVAMREIEVAGGKEPPVIVYDTSGPYTDPAVTTDIRLGPSPLRGAWIKARGDVEEIDGRAARPEDDGLRAGEANDVPKFDRAGRKPLRGKLGKAVTQLAYARAGIVTPEMEYIAIRENR